MRVFRVLETIENQLDIISRYLMAVSSISLFLMFIIINVEVVGRYFFGFSTMISDEYSGYLFAAIVMLGLLYVQRQGLLLRVDAVRLRVSNRTQEVLDIFNALLGVVVGIIVTYAVWRTFSISWMFQTTSNQTSQTLLFFPQVVMPIGMGLISLSFMEEFLRRILTLLNSLINKWEGNQI